MRIEESGIVQKMEQTKMVNSPKKQRQDASETMSTTELMDFINQKKQELLEKVQKGDTQEKIPIGGASFTTEEWEKLLTKVDKNVDAIKRNQEDRKEQQKEEALEKQQLKQQENGDVVFKEPVLEMSDEVLENLLLHKPDHFNTMDL